MTNQEALQILDVITAAPMGDPAYSPYLLLIRAALQRIAREVEDTRRDLAKDARSGAAAPDDFDIRLAAYNEGKRDDEEFAAILDKVNDIFAPAWQQLMSAEARLHFPKLTPGQFAALYSAVKAQGDTLPLGESTIPSDEWLAFIAATIVA